MKPTLSTLRFPCRLISVELALVDASSCLTIPTANANRCGPTCRVGLTEAQSTTWSTTPIETYFFVPLDLGGGCTDTLRVSTTVVVGFAFAKAGFTYSPVFALRAVIMVLVAMVGFFLLLCRVRVYADH